MRFLFLDFAEVLTFKGISGFVSRLRPQNGSPLVPCRRASEEPSLSSGKDEQGD